MNDNSSFERVEKFKELGKPFTNKNSFQEEIKGRLKSRNVCCHSKQGVVSSSLLSENIKSKIHRNIVLSMKEFGLRVLKIRC